MSIPYFSCAAVYIEPAVVTFTATPQIAELGSTVSSVVLNWSLNKNVISQTLDGDSLGAPETVLTVDGPFTTPDTWTLTITDGQTTSKAKTTLDFQNKLYWGNVVSSPSSSADLLALDYSAFSTTAKKQTQQGSPGGKYPCFAYPVRLGTPNAARIGVPNTSITPSVVWSDFTDFNVGKMPFTNSSGYTEDYYIITFNNPRSDSSLIVEWNYRLPIANLTITDIGGSSDDFELDFSNPDDFTLGVVGMM